MMLNRPPDLSSVDCITASAYQVARQHPPDQFIEWCFDQLGHAFGAHQMMWSIVVPPASSEPINHQNRLYEKASRDGYRIDRYGVRSSEDPQRLSEEYSEVEHSHPLLPLALANPAKGYSFDSLSDAAVNSTHLSLEFVRFSRLHDIPKSMMIAFPGSRTVNVDTLILWRRQSDPSFTSEDIDRLERIAAHLTQGLQHSRAFTLSSRILDFWDKHNAVMTLNPSGFPVDIDERFEKVIDKQWPDTSSDSLPDELKTLLEPDSPNTFRKGDVLFNRYCIDAYRILVATELGALANLTQRELEISILFANGEDHKTIAANINRSSSTVRNHLRNIYHKLGIKSRSELAEQLQRLTSMPR